MTIARVSLSLVGVVGIVAATLAGATIWLLVTQPVTTADAIGAATQGEISPLVKALAGAIYEALEGLLKYL
jgi:multidrug resistance efflux pump